MIAALPSLFRVWRFWASSAHPREAVSDIFLATPTKQYRGLRRRARDHARGRSHLHSSVVVSRVLREMLRYSDWKKTLTIRNTWFPPTGRKFVYIFRPNRIEINLIHKK